MTLRGTSCVVAVAATGPYDLRTQTYGGGCSSPGSGGPARAVGASRDDLVEPPTGRSAAGAGPGVAVPDERRSEQKAGFRCRPTCGLPLLRAPPSRPVTFSATRREDSWMSDGSAVVGWVLGRVVSGDLARRDHASTTAGRELQVCSLSSRRAVGRKFLLVKLFRL